MQFVADGPDIPDEVFQTLEDERLILFCGAGLSMASNLPSFKRLVELVIERTGVDGIPSVDDEQLDRILELIEKKIGERMRQEVLQILRQEPKKSGIASQRAVLDLARLRDGRVRCVTTNFDNLFDRGARRSPRVSLRIDSAPTVPVPKPDRWDTLVYLHGRIDPGDPTGRDLVLTSSDFGRAYLTDGWASRFMTELFRHFSVLFVGYSLDDPVMRYLLDALAADRKFTTGPQQAYALVPYSPLTEAEDREAWEAKEVLPIFYSDRKGHSVLHKTLRLWAEQKLNGLTARASIIKSLAPDDPKSLEPRERNQLIWAIREPSGYCSREFSTLQPIPPIAWLDVFPAEELGLKPGKRPSHGALVSNREIDGTLDLPNNIPLFIGGWMARHICDPRLLEWVLKAGGLLHKDLRDNIRYVLSHEVCPWPKSLTTAWEIMSSGSSVVRRPETALYGQLASQLRTGSWTPTLKLRLLDALQPYLLVSPATGLSSLLSDKQVPIAQTPISAFVGGHVLLVAGDHARELVDSIATTADHPALSEIAHELSSSICRTFDLYSLLGTAAEDLDLSYISRPSIAPHGQNTNFEQWTTLVDLLIAAFDRLDKTDREAARALVSRWSRERYPVFRRLALYAAERSAHFTPNEKLRLLL